MDAKKEISNIIYQNDQKDIGNKTVGSKNSKIDIKLPFLKSKYVNPHLGTHIFACMIYIHIHSLHIELIDILFVCYRSWLQYLPPEKNRTKIGTGRGKL